MEFSNNGMSVYHRLQAIYVRNISAESELLYCKGPRKQKIEQEWQTIRSRLDIRNSDGKFPTSRLGSGILLDECQGFVLYEKKPSRSSSVTGMILSIGANTDSTDTTFERFFVELMLDKVDFAIRPPVSTLPASGNGAALATERIVTVFENYLLYKVKDDRWKAEGRAYFWDHVHHFTSHDAKVEFCLPAFPCKSSNLNKVIGTDPDRGEELALSQLHGFVEAVEQIYSPGAKIWIISDGHVFSDCIGIDDEDVDIYGQKLKQMNHEISLSRGCADRVGFKSLVDLFELQKSISQKELSRLSSRLNIAGIQHHIATRLTEEAELCRQILMAGCQPDRSTLRAKLESQDNALLALYRGFSRFMLEDLELHPATQDMSRSKQRKLATKVSFEMIMRNQAYSNLVELIFPNHVRLSIHAHNNAGPKFGIQLFDPLVVRAVESLSPDAMAMKSSDLLHIPTPWHNCVVEVEGSNVLLVTKSKVAKEQLTSGRLEGVIVEGRTHIGAHFMVRAPRNRRTGNAKEGEVASSPSILSPVMELAIAKRFSVVNVTRPLAACFLVVSLLLVISRRSLREVA